MAQKDGQFFKQSVAGAPVIRSLRKRITIWTTSWFLATVLTTTGFAMMIHEGHLMGRGTGWWILWLLPALVVSALVMGAVVLYIHDKTQTDEPVQRMFPVLYWGRKFSVGLGPLLRQYLFASDQEETPYNRITRNWIYQTARGGRNTVGFGSQSDMDQVGATIVLPATFTNSSSKTGEEVGHCFKKVIGAHTGVEPVTLDHFVCISAMSYGALSFRAHAALNQGAKEAGILHNTGEGGLAPCHEYGGGGLILQIGTAKYGLRGDDGNLNDEVLARVAQHEQVKLLEIKLAQGAKPGKGGMLLKEKITPEIARIRKIPLGQDSHSPARHSEFDDVHGLFDFIDRIRRVGRKPVGIKMVIGHTAEIEAIAEKMAAEPGRGPDYISIDGGDGGTGAAPLVLSSYTGLPMKPAVAVADWALKRHGVRDRVAIFGSGKIATPIEVAVAMALGADVVYIARGFLFALGCIQALDCHTNECPTGIATQDLKLQKALDIRAAATRVATYATKLYNETQMLAESCGYDSPDQITPDDIMVVTSPGHLDYLSELHGISAYEASLEMSAAKAMGMTVGEMKMRKATEDRP